MTRPSVTYRHTLVPCLMGVGHAAIAVSALLDDRPVYAALWLLVANAWMMVWCVVSVLIRRAPAATTVVVSTPPSPEVVAAQVADRLRGAGY